MRTSRRALTGGLCFSALAPTFGAFADDGAQAPRRERVDELLRERVAHISAGENDFAIAVGWLAGGRQRHASFGRIDGTREADAETRFEIGSLTKSFTAIALAEMVLRGELALDEPANRHLPSNLQLRDRLGVPVTLLELATHTSGLPFMPPEQALASREDAAAWLHAFNIEGATPGWDYSNVGYWLVGEAMAARGGVSFEELLRARVLAPMRLRNTSFAPTDYAVGRDASMRQAPAISALPGFGFMPGAGGLFSSVEDLLTVARVAMREQRSPLANAIALTINTRVPGAGATQAQALGWSVLTGEPEIIMRDGGTLGSASCAAWRPGAQGAVVVLSNQVTGVADIARHLLDPTFPLSDVAPARHVEVRLDHATLDSFAGRYQHEEEGAFDVARDGDGLVLTLPDSWGLPPVQLRAEGQTDFFALELPLRARFQRDEQGRVTGMLIYPPRGQHALRTTRAPSP